MWDANLATVQAPLVSKLNHANIAIRPIPIIYSIVRDGPGCQKNTITACNRVMQWCRKPSITACNRKIEFEPDAVIYSRHESTYKAAHEECLKLAESQLLCD